MKKLNKKSVKLALKILISGAFLFWVVFKVNWWEVWFYLKGINLWYLAAYVVILLLGMVISSYKWQRLSEFKGINLPLFEFFKLYISGTFINNFMPSFIGGDAYKAYESGKKDERYVEAASAVMMDRITGLVAACVLSLLFGALNFREVMEHKILLAADLVVLALLISDFLIAEIKKISFLKKMVRRFAPEKFVAFLKELDGFNDQSGIMTRSVLLGTVFSMIGLALVNYVLFLALGIKMNVLDYLSAIFIVSIIASFPLTINNIGLKEWSYITFFGLFIQNPAAAVTVAIISRFIQMLVSFLALPFYLRKK